MKYMVMFIYSICGMHFDIMKAIGLISGISVGSLYILAIYYSSAKALLFCNKKKDLVKFELTFLFRKLHLLS